MKYDKRHSMHSLNREKKQAIHKKNKEEMNQIINLKIGSTKHGAQYKVKSTPLYKQRNRYQYNITRMNQIQTIPKKNKTQEIAQ